MKKKIFFFAILVIAIMSVFAISVSAANNIIKLDTLPTLEQIHANPSAYVSHLDEFDKDTYATYREKDSTSVIVFSDLAETPTYYVYPAYYFVRGSEWNGKDEAVILNGAIAAADSTAFANYSVFDRGGSLYYIRVEMPTYITKLSGWNKFEGSTNVKEIYFPTHIVEDAQTGKLKEVAYLTTIENANIFSSCSKLEVIHNMEFLPAGINNDAGFSGCSSLRSVVLPEGITSISGSLFNGCSSLTSIKVPSTVTSVGGYAFNGCSSLTEIILPNGVVSFGKRVFGGCSKLEKVVVGAGFTTFSSGNSDYETFDGCTSLKYIYLPATFANAIQATSGQYKHIFNYTTNTKTIYFVTEDSLEAVQAIQAKFAATNNNKNIAGADIELYDPTKDYTAYHATLTKSVIVYGYNKCEAFYNNNHNYRNTTQICLDGVTCTQCGDNVTTFAQHNMKETLVYGDFIAEGIYNKFCTNASNCEYERVTDRVAPAIFRVNENNGFSTDGADGIAFGGFVLDSEALDEYNRINSDATINYGVVLINPNYVFGKDSFFKNGEVNAEKGFLKTDMSNARYANISISVTGFKGDAEDLSLILAIYAYTDADEVQYIQSKESVAYSSKVTLGTERLYAVTLASVKDGDKTLADLDEYVVPTSKKSSSADLPKEKTEVDNVVDFN